MRLIQRVIVGIPELSVCCADGCDAQISPSQLACKRHWGELTSTEQRAWKRAWADVLRGVPAALHPRLRTQLEAKLVGRMLTARRRATKRLAQGRQRITP